GVRPTNEDRMPHAEALQQRVQILRADLRCVPARRLGRFALRTRIESDDSIGFCERVYLMKPNFPARAPAGNKNYRRYVARLACFDQPQGDAVANFYYVR